MFSVILLKSKRYIIVRSTWIENPKFSVLTKVFYSPNEFAVPDFSLDTKYLFDKRCAGAYQGFLIRHFQTMLEAEKFIDNKRVVFPSTYKPCKFVLGANSSIVEYISLDDDDVVRFFGFFPNSFLIIFSQSSIISIFVH